MKLPVTLSLAVAALLPCLARPVDSPLAHVETEAVASAVDAAPATPEQRAMVFGALALMPADVGDFLTVADIGSNLAHLCSHSTLSRLSEADIPELWRLMDDVAIASSSANRESYAAIATILADYLTLREMEIFITEGVEAAHEQADFSFRMEAARRGLRMMSSLDKLFSEAKLHPVYAAVTCREGYGAALQDIASSLLREMQELAAEGSGIELVQDINGFSGIRVDMSKGGFHRNFRLSKLFCPLIGKGPRRSPSEVFSGVVEQEAASRFFYLMLRQEGNALVGAVCEDPSELKLAATPAESVLATDAVAGADARLHGGMFGLVRLSNELMACATASPAEHVSLLGEAVAGLFKRLALRHADHEAEYHRAAEGALMLASSIAPMLAPGTQPLSAMCWLDDNLNVRVEMDSPGFEFEQAPIRHAARLSSNSTACYVGSTPLRYPEGFVPSLPHITEASIMLAGGMMYALEEHARHYWQMSVMRHDMVARYLSRAISQFVHPFNGSFALVLDGQSACFPPVAGGAGELQGCVPRVGASFGVKDREALDNCLSGILYAIRLLTIKVNPDVAPITLEADNQAWGHTFRLSCVNPSCLVTIRQDGDSLIAGNCMTMNGELAQTATASPSGAGAVLLLNFAPLCHSLHSLAETDRYSDYGALLRGAAGFMEGLSMLGRGFYATATTQEGRLILNARLLLK